MSGDSYSQRQQSRDAEYERAYREWTETMTPEDRAKAQSLGVDEAHVERRGGGCVEGDLADSPLASETPDIVEAIEPSRQAPLDPDRASDERVMEIFRRMLGELITQPNLRLNLECLALAAEVSFLGDSEAEIAKRHGVSRSAVSKRCVELTKRLELPPSHAMRRLTAREAYARTQHRIRDSHERIHRRGRKRKNHD